MWHYVILWLNYVPHTFKERKKITGSERVNLLLFAGKKVGEKV
jgi:hypothetical protein